MLTSLKKELLWLKEVDSIPLQAELQNLDAAYQGFFRRVKKGEKPGYPRFKSKRDRRKSYKTKQHVSNGKPTIWVDAEHIRLPKLGLVKCRVSKEVEGRILSATVSVSYTHLSRRDAAADLSEDGQLCLRILEFKFKIYHRKLFSY